MATNLYDLFKTFVLSCLSRALLAPAQVLPSGFTKALFLDCIFPLWHRCFPLDFTGALFFAPFETLPSLLCLKLVGTCGLLHVFVHT